MKDNHVMKNTVFYSWQSDLPNRTNRSFIQNALHTATKSMLNYKSLSVTPVIDRDTVGLPGSPEIAQAIFSKIDKCMVFVADVSIVGHTNEGKGTPNPNVLIELGYAIRALSENRIILVQNTAFGTPSDLPFDIRTKRILTYKRGEIKAHDDSSKKELAKKLENAIHMVAKSFDGISDEKKSKMQKLQREIFEFGDFDSEQATFEAVKILKKLNREGVSEVWLDGTCLRKAPLQNINLSGSHLLYVDFRDANLIGANLKGTFLGGADFRGAKLINAQFQSADLSGAQFQNADLMNAHFDDAILMYANMENSLNLSIDQIKKCDQCYYARMDNNLLKEIKINYRHLWINEGIDSAMNDGTIVMLANGRVLTNE